MLFKGNFSNDEKGNLKPLDAMIHPSKEAIKGVVFTAVLEFASLVNVTENIPSPITGSERTLNY